MINTYIKLPGLDLKNPVTPANGAFGFGDVPAAKRFDLNDPGAMVIRATTPHAATGNPQPRMAVLETGVLDSVGLASPGVDTVIGDKLRPLRQSYPDLPIMASVGGENETGYVEIAKKLFDSGLVNALKINVSCPNINRGGMSSGVHPDVVESLTKKTKAVASVPIYLKLTPNVTDITQISKAAGKGGADGLSLTNTLLGMDIDIRTGKSVLGHNIGSLSGETVKPVALRMVHQVRQSTSLPIIGMGGISSVQDVVKFMLASASVAVVETAHFKDSIASKHITDELPNKLEKLGIEGISDLVNQAGFN